MGSGLLPMFFTVAGAVYVYYLLGVKMGFSETAGMVLGVLILFKIIWRILEFARHIINFLENDQKNVTGPGRTFTEGRGYAPGILDGSSEQ